MWEFIACIVLIVSGYALGHVERSSEQTEIARSCERLGTAWIAGKAYHCGPKEPTTKPAKVPRT